MLKFVNMHNYVMLNFKFSVWNENWYHISKINLNYYPKVHLHDTEKQNSAISFYTVFVKFLADPHVWGCMDQLAGRWWVIAHLVAEKL